MKIILFAVVLLLCFFVLKSCETAESKSQQVEWIA
ncbi:hypothetical protein UFOVP581_39 [uncultured Caudovirales phage]|uniref:Uncharacterized protein n=1 Tax=uncultured Caudovirales phage TaxID=2100421 RepID=A0A6J5PHS6_9CAUD|nr:hypothetical protein UFOVP581_39 [uncultured Caudovirales phage]